MGDRDINTDEGEGSMGDGTMKTLKLVDENTGAMKGDHKR